ncbi:hypothetical protein EV199_5784 [Pseudobacter ginsenosidimutans]|uniref:Outer membrane protein with beta-barrel domain n=2 Tax=Pseudobacter ginsenosidimutans TaxID=661488 RepID=A0A4V2EZ27_9BACT|nr:hypothetical protein EV199_5784 [Pseudobacter ginsenosidimutans]
MRNSFTLLCLFCLFLTGCVSESYFQSPMHSNNSSYKTIPMHSDSIGSATYIGGNFFPGFANHRLRDTYFGGNASLFRSHNFGNFQGYYGLNATVGQYRVNYNKDIDGDLQTSPYFKQGDHFFGAVGGTGGINVVSPFRKGEWRVLGAELSYQQEFGDYYKFRNKLPDSAVRYVDKRDHYFTWGLNTEILGDVGKSWLLGYKAAYIMNLHTLRSYQSGNRLHPAYFSQTIHLSHLNTTGYVQMNAGTRVLSLHFGVNYRLGR